MSQELVQILADAFWGSMGSIELAALLIIILAALYILKYGLDRGGIVLLGLLIAGYGAMPVAVGGFGIIPLYAYFIILIAAGAYAALGFINIGREA